MHLFRSITSTLHIIEIINKWCRRKLWEGGGARGEDPCCRLQTAGLLAWSLWDIGTRHVNVLVLHIVLATIHIRTDFEHRW